MKSIPRIIEEQVQRWQIMQQKRKEEKEGVPSSPYPEIRAASAFI